MQESIDRGIGISSNRVAVTDHVRANLESAAKWARLVALGGFFLSGFCLVFSFVSFKAGLSIAFLRESYFLRGVVELILAVVAFFPGFYVQRFRINILRSLNNDDTIDFEVGMEYLKSLFRLMGIYAIIVIAIILVWISLFIYVQLIWRQF